MKKLHWVNLHFKDLAIEVMDKNTTEKGLFLDKIIKDLFKGESDNEFITSMINESKEFFDKKSKAGKKSAEKRAANKLNDVEKCLNDDETMLNTPSTITTTTTTTRTKEIKELKDFVDSSEYNELKSLTLFWNSLSWTNNIKVGSGSIGDKLSKETILKRIKTFNLRKKFFNKENDSDFSESLKAEIIKHSEHEGKNWFNLITILESQNKVEKLLSGHWLGVSGNNTGNKLKTTSNEELNDFYNREM